MHHQVLLIFNFNFKIILVPLLLSLLFICQTGGIYHRITLTGMSIGNNMRWYPHLSSYELVIFEIIFFKILLARYLQLLPINLNDFFAGKPLGKRRKRSLVVEEIDPEHEKLAESMFSLLRRLDESDCFLKTLCELQVRSSSSGVNHQNSLGFHMIQIKKEKSSNCTSSLDELLLEFSDAFYYGTYGNYSKCSEKFTKCPLEQNEMLQILDSTLDSNLLDDDENYFL